MNNALYEELDFGSACALALSLFSFPAVDIAVHRNPDADTLGCALALAATLSDNGVSAMIKCEDKIPDALTFLTCGYDIDALPRGCAAVAVDVASDDQLGSLYDKMRDSFILALDHHGKGSRFAPCFCEPDTAACGEIVYRIITTLAKEGKIKEPPTPVWTYIYAAISGDTGSFRYGNTTPQSHRIAAELLERGARAEWCAHRLHAVKTPAMLTAERIALTNMRSLCGGKLAVTAISAKEIADAGLISSDFSDSADKMRCIDGVLVGVSMREAEPGKWRTSMRANVPVDCSVVAASLGGGGHIQAAGCTVSADGADNAVAVITERISAQIKLYEASLL